MLFSSRRDFDANVEDVDPSLDRVQSHRRVGRLGSNSLWKVGSSCRGVLHGHNIVCSHHGDYFGGRHQPWK